jgi:V8-like Glu-specific endopeptidase
MADDPMPQPPVNANPRAAVAPGKAGPPEPNTGTVVMPQRPQAPSPLVGRPASIASAGPPAKGDGVPVYEYKHGSGEWLPAETATHDDRDIPIPPAPTGYRHLVVHVDPVRHHAAGTRALRLHAPYAEEDDAPAGSFRKRYPGASKAEAEQRAQDYMSGQRAPDMYDEDPAAYADSTAAEQGTPDQDAHQRRGWRKAEGDKQP